MNHRVTPRSSPSLEVSSLASHEVLRILGSAQMRRDVYMLLPRGS
jgi:hypothetical protein